MMSIEWTRDSVAQALDLNAWADFAQAAAKYNAVVRRPLVGETCYLADPNRCSGRTTKMLCAALASALNGACGVFIVMDGDDVADIYSRRTYEQFVKLSGVDESNAKEVKALSGVIQFTGDLVAGIRGQRHRDAQPKRRPSQQGPATLFIDHTLAQRRIEEAQAIIQSMRDTLEMDGKALDLCSGRYYLLTGNRSDHS
jgi:hypothetical protein